MTASAITGEAAGSVASILFKESHEKRDWLSEALGETAIKMPVTKLSLAPCSEWGKK